MKLSDIAECNMRAETIDAAAEGAPNLEWHLQIRRDGRLPTEDTPAYKRWLSELKTFCKPEYFNVPVDCKPTMQSSKHTYAAVFVWQEFVEDIAPAKVMKRAAPTEIHITPIPCTPEEIAAWARTLGQGVRIRNVNVFSGELSPAGEV